jgi:hypothetical protein
MKRMILHGRKGKEILDIVSKIVSLIPENDEYLMDIKACMLSDAAQLTVRVAGAEAARLYDLKMENAVIIRKAARDLMVGIGPFDKDPDDNIPFHGFEDDTEE